MNKIVRQNPNSSGSLFLSITAIVLMLLNLPLLPLIALVISLKQISKAKKANENKQFIIIGYVFISIPIILWATNIVFFVISNLREAGAL